MDILWFVNLNFGISFKFLVCNSLILLLFCLLRGERNKERVNRRYTKTLKMARMTRFKLPILDGFISLFKLKTGDTRFWEGVFNKHGMNCRLPFLLSEIIAITDPLVVQKILNSKHDGHLSKPRFIYDLLFTDFLKDGLLASTLETWSAHRTTIVGCFNYNSFPTYLRYINEGAKAMIILALSESSKCGAKSVVENAKMTEIVHQCTLQIITHMILGQDVSMVSNESLENFQETHQKWKTIVLERLLNPLLIIPPVWNFHSKKHQMENYIEELLNFEYSIVNRYRSRLQSNSMNVQTGQAINTTEEIPTQSKKENFQCMIEKMISANMTNKEIADEIGMFMVAGHETIVVAIGMLSFYLACYPEHQKRCQEEIDSLYLSKMCNQTQDLGLDQLTELKFLERCILEGLRIAPPVPLFLRQLESPLEVEKNLFLDVGETVLISPWLVHRNPTLYPKPEVFDPDRFLPENVKMRPAHAFIPFSMGPRNCIGWKVALMEMKVLMASILRHFYLTTEDKPGDVKLHFDVTLKPERPYNVKFTRRSVT